MNKIMFLLAALSLHGVALAQTTQPSQQSGLSYNYAELRFVDVDENGGDGLRIGGSFELAGPWILLGSYTALDFDGNVDADVLDVGGGYVWNYTGDFDLIGTARLVYAEFDSPSGGDDETGFALSGGTRGLLTPQFEIRGSVNHINLDDSDTYLEIAGDYYFTRQLSAGLSLEFAGDTDVLTFGARWFFR